MFGIFDSQPRDNESAGDRRITIQTESADAAQILKGAAEDAAKLLNTNASKVNTRILYDGLIPPNTEGLAQRLYCIDERTGRPWFTVYDCLSALSEEYAASAGLCTREDEGLKLLDWGFDFSLRSCGDFNQDSEECGYVIQHMRYLGDFIKGDEAFKRDFLQFPDIVLQDGYPSYRAFNIVKALRDGWKHWHGHSYVYRVLSVLWRNTRNTLPYVDTPYDRRSLLMLASELYDDCHRYKASEPAELKVIEPKFLKIDSGGGGNA